MGFRPLHDRVVVKRLDSESKTAGGIIIPDTAKEKPMEGKVIAVGPGARDDNGRITSLDVKNSFTRFSFLYLRKIFNPDTLCIFNFEF